MAAVISEGRLAELAPGVSRYSYGSGLGTGVHMYGDHFEDYAAIWRTQPALRRVTSFLARNIAQLGLPVFRRVGDNDRQRLASHPLAELIRRPNPWTTRYRLLDALVHDLCIYDNAYWVKVPTPTPAGLSLVRITPARMRPLGNTIRPASYLIEGTKGSLEIGVDQVVHFRGYNPVDSATGISPLETLRRVLAEEKAMGAYRENLWDRGARPELVLKRPVGAPVMSPEAKDRFWARFNAQHTGEAGSTTALLEEGMEVQQISFSAKDAQWMEARKLNTEEVAAQYHVPLPMVGILDHATFSNITEQHKQLYQDTLGPTLVMIEEDIELQLLPDMPDRDSVYVEFNLAEKLRGSFEEQAAQIQTATGAPWLTRNEARARVNLPAVDGGDELVTPLNVLAGGQASPTDSAPPPKAVPTRHTKALVDALPAGLSSIVKAHTAALVAHFAAQRDAADGGDDLKGEEWDNRLAEALLPLASKLAAKVGGRMAQQFSGEWDGDRAAAYLGLNALYGAKNINEGTRRGLNAARAADPEGGVADFWQVQLDSRAASAAEGRVVAVSRFAEHEGAKQAGAETKTWHSHGSNNRPAHARLDGAQVGIEDTFELGRGARWPHDHGIGDPDEIAGCTCTVTFHRGD